MSGERNEVRHDAASLHQFVSSIADLCERRIRAECKPEFNFSVFLEFVNIEGAYNAAAHSSVPKKIVGGRIHYVAMVKRFVQFAAHALRIFYSNSKCFV